MAIKLTSTQVFVLAWPLLIDTLFAIVTLGWWAPELYKAAYSSGWMEDWVYERRFQLRRKAAATPKQGEQHEG